MPVLGQRRLVPFILPYTPATQSWSVQSALVSHFGTLTPHLRPMVVWKNWKNMQQTLGIHWPRSRPQHPLWLPNRRSPRVICFSFSFFHVFAASCFVFFSISNLSVSALCVARGALTRGPAPRNLVTVGNISRPQRNSLFEYICIRHRGSGNRANPPEITGPQALICSVCFHRISNFKFK